MSIKELLKETEIKMKNAIEATKREFQEVRTGRANPSLVEGLRINYYGSPMLLKQLASISIPDAHLLVIQPWDPSIIPEIEKAIFAANLGVTPSNDGKFVRLSFPPLSEETRQELIKLVKKMAEEGRISLRTIRREANETVKRMQTEKKISEDERFRTQEEIQKLTDKYIQQIEEILENKEKELKEF
jgi:ribosome recycling factor